jgi:hypothetical protein
MLEEKRGVQLGWNNARKRGRELAISGFEGMGHFRFCNVS